MVKGDNEKIVGLLALASVASVALAVWASKRRDKKFEAYFTVSDIENGVPIDGAVIAVEGQNTVTTDANGEAIVGPFKKGTYAFTVDHPDYYQYSDSFTASNITGYKITIAVMMMRRPSFPDSLPGAVWRTFGNVAEYEDVTAFLYYDLETAHRYVHVKSNDGSKDYPILDYFEMGVTYVDLELTARNKLWIAYGVPLKIRGYTIGETELTVDSTDTFGDAYTRLWGFIRLASGKLIVAWYQHIRDEGVNVGFAYRSLGEWVTIPYTWVYPTGPSCHCNLRQHPDGSIWFFHIGDAYQTIAVIHLVEDGEDIFVDWTDMTYISVGDGAMRPEGELPWLNSVADPSRNAIILAYQNYTGHLFSADPFCKGANVAVVQCNSNATKSLLFVMERWVERVSAFCVGLDLANNVWLAYGMIDAEELTWNDLYVTAEDEDSYLGELKDGNPTDAATVICNSFDYVIANMADDMVHFYSR